jgi:hypothetical protein
MLNDLQKAVVRDLINRRTVELEYEIRNPTVDGKHGPKRARLNKQEMKLLKELWEAVR